MSLIEDALLEKMQLFLDYSVQRQKVISSNLANVETPGYRAKDIRFEEVFRRELAGEAPLRISRARHVRGNKPVLLRPRVEEVETGSLGNDQNNVDMDRELTALAQNVLKFSVVSQLIQKKLAGIAYSIREGR